MGDAAVEVEDAIEDEDAGNWWPRTAAIAAMTASTPAARILRIRSRLVGRARLLEGMPPVKAASCCRHVSGFRDVDDMPRL